MISIERHGAVVVGGGPAGAMAAAHLARAGREVLLLERERGPSDKVCGEFLSYEAQGYLGQLGIDLDQLGAVEIDQVRLFAGSAQAAAELPFRALSLSRRVMDEALIDFAAQSGAEIRRGVRVTGLVRAGDGWSLDADGRGRMLAQDVFLATGKHDLRDHRRPRGLQSDLIGFKLHYRLAPKQAQDLRRSVEIHLFAGGYAGLELVEGAAANLCLLVRRSAFANIGSSWEALLGYLLSNCPTLRRRMDGATPLMVRPLAVSAIPYGFVRRRSDGLWRLGDQAAVIPSFAGEGMSIAMHSAHLAAKFYLAGDSADDFQLRLAKDVSAQVLRATLLSQALVRPFSQSVIGVICRTFPPLLAEVARVTRLPPSSVRTLVAHGFP